MSGLPTLLDVYKNYKDWQTTKNNYDTTRIIDGVAPNIVDINYNDPAAVSIEEIKQRPVAPHCKRHYFVDKDGKTRSVLVCQD